MDRPLIRSLVGVAIFAVAFSTRSPAAQRDARGPQGRDFLLLQGPGSDVRATVRALVATDRGPQGQHGIVIETVVRNGPADAAGLRAGDIVTEFDSLPIGDPKQFERTVRDTAPGRRVTVVFWRNGNRREVSITPVLWRAR